MLNRTELSSKSSSRITTGFFFEMKAKKLSHSLIKKKRVTQLMKKNRAKTVTTPNHNLNGQTKLLQQPHNNNYGSTRLPQQTTPSNPQTRISTTKPINKSNQTVVDVFSIAPIFLLFVLKDFSFEMDLAFLFLALEAFALNKLLSWRHDTDTNIPRTKRYSS
jgi:hypothetical protein